MDFTNENNLIKDQECSIFYSGDLYQKNSDRVFIVYGFGNNWEHTTEKEMLKQENGFLAKIRMLQYNNIHFCFRNSNYEWDNNNSANYTLPILEADKNLSQETSSNTITNNKNELLNNILEESNTELDYIQEFDIDNLIEEILAPLLEERSYYFEENEVSDAKVNESVTILLNKELYSETPKTEALETEKDIKLPSFSTANSEFSIDELIDELKNDIIKTTSTLVAESNISAKKEENLVAPTFENEVVNSTENDNSDLSSIVVDEILYDITQIFDDSETATTQLEETLIPENIEENVNSNVDEDSTETEQVVDKNNDDDDNNITPLNTNSEDNNSYEANTEESDVDVADTDIEVEQEDSEVTSEENLSDDVLSDSVAACTALAVRDEDRFIICSRKLTKFYMIRKKIKLAIYKLFFAIPRMMKRELNTNKNQD